MTRRHFLGALGSVVGMVVLDPVLKLLPADASYGSVMRGGYRDGKVFMDFVSRKKTVVTFDYLMAGKTNGGDEAESISFRTNFKHSSRDPLAFEFWNEGELIDRKILPGGNPDQWHAVEFCKAGTKVISESRSYNMPDYMGHCAYRIPLEKNWTLTQNVA